ncbi:MAG: ABC-2 transporter permease [Peptostreptococcaceae bacterium]|nr:ABC-2 transporter permease [Peptostreptococcaceae bacterium]
MKGLLIKNFREQHLLFLVSGILMMGVSFLSYLISGEIKITFLIFLLFVLINTMEERMFFNDEKTGWQIFAMALPLSRKCMVLARYLTSFIRVVILSILCIAIPTVFRKSFQMQDLLLLLIVMGAAFIQIHIYLPLRYRFSSNLTATGLGFIYTAAILPMIFYLDPVVSGGNMDITLKTLVFEWILAALSGVISMVFSCRIFEKKEF